MSAFIAALVVLSHPDTDEDAPMFYVTTIFYVSAFVVSVIMFGYAVHEEKVLEALGALTTMLVLAEGLVRKARLWYKMRS